jgi:lysophospholipase L1-like esterase
LREGLSKGLLACAGLAVGLVILEIGVRALGLAPEIAPIQLDQPYAAFETHPNPILQYVPRPGSRDINADGLRDRSYATEKPEGTFRVVVLGDSIGFGFCTISDPVPRDKTFSEVLERRLDADPPAGWDRVEVINLSVSGYDTTQEAEYLRVKGLAYQPDMVVVGYCLNDVRDASFELAALRQDERFGQVGALGAHAMRRVFEASHLVRVLWLRFAAPGAESDVGQAASPDRRGEGFDHLRELAEDEDFDTLVAIFPYLDASVGYPHSADHRDTRAEADARGFAVVDLLPAFLEASGGHLPELRGRCIGMHPDERGHRVAAGAIERAIRQHMDERSD